jgi:hypothetical protein
LSGILSSFKRGEDSHSAAELAEARAAVERAELLLTGQHAKADRLAKAAPQTDARLAELVAEAVSKMVPYAAEVIPTFVRPAEAPEDMAAGPVIVVTQETKATDKGGILAAELTIRSFRLPHFQQIDYRDVQEEFQARGWDIERGRIYQNTEKRSDFIVDVIRVQKLQAHADIPTITEDPDETGISAVASSVAFEMVKAYPITGEIMADLSLAPSGKGARNHMMTAVVRSKRFKVTQAGEKRRVSIEAEYELDVNTPSVTIDMLRRAAADGVQALSDKFFPGVGKVDNVSDFLPRSNDLNVVGVRVNLVSKVG